MSLSGSTPLTFRKKTCLLSDVTNRASLYSKDVSGSAELFARDEAGNVTQISPHNNQGEWIYYSENVKTGKRFKVNMEKMIRKLEQITGQNFIEIDDLHK